MQKSLFVSSMANHAADLYAALTARLRRRLGIVIGVVEQAPWDERERTPCRGTAHLEAICEPYYVYAADHV